MSEEMSLEELFSEIKKSKEFKSLARRVLNHPECTAKAVLSFVVSSSRYFENEDKSLRYWGRWLDSCTLSRGLFDNKNLLAQLSVEDTIKILTTNMSRGDEDIYSHLEKLLSQMTLREQFRLFDRLINRSRRWRSRRIVYQYTLIYLVQNFNVPPRKKKAKSLMKLATIILGKPNLSYAGDPLMDVPDDVLIAFRQTTRLFSK